MVIETREPTGDDGLSDFLSARGSIFGVAYRLMRDAGGAEDVVQDTWLRWQRHDRSTVRDPAAFLATTAHHLAINELTSARSRHEVTSQDWRGYGADDGDPAALAERRAALEQATQMLIERLTPGERAAFVLRVGFDYSYAQIAELLGTSSAGARQLVSRARRDLLRAPAHPAPSGAVHRHLVRELVLACRTGDLERLEMLLRDDLGLRRRKHRARRAQAG